MSKKSKISEAIMQYYYQFDKNDIGSNFQNTSGVNPQTSKEVDNDSEYVPTLFPNTVNMLNRKTKMSSFNNTEDIRTVNSYMDFLYENGDVFVDGMWYKTPYDAIREVSGGIVRIKQAILEGKVCRRLGLDRIY